MSRTQEQINQPKQNVYAGIDVSKAHLDFYASPMNVTSRVTNDTQGIQKLIRQCAQHGVDLVAMEATGIYHRLAHDMFHNAGIPVAVINPFRSRQFADSLGKFAKTDTIDARVLARFAELMKPKRSIPPSRHHKALRELHTARRQVLGKRVVNPTLIGLRPS